MRLEDEKFGDMSPYGVRLPSELKAKIKAAAKEKRHSMNAEIVERLESSFNEHIPPMIGDISSFFYDPNKGDDERVIAILSSIIETLKGKA